MIYCFDLDNTLCNTDNKEYINSTPIQEMVDRVNFLYDSGDEIIIFTARGMGKFKGDTKKVYDTYYNLTLSQLEKWKIKYNKLILGKPSFDFFIDDKNKTIMEFKSQTNPIVGFTAGCFDVIHPGYIDMFETIKKNCDYLIVGLQENPNQERPEKSEVILGVEYRAKILYSLRYVDEVIIYKTEDDLMDILKTKKIDIRFIGDDYKEKTFTGSDFDMEYFYINRSHGWSSSKFKKLIQQSKI
jgi:glycerol-3-phosphate cytidylyltransferase